MRENWKVIRLEDLCSKVYSGGTPSSKKQEYYHGNIPWLNTKEVDFKNIRSTEKYITELGLQKSSAKWVPKNTVIVAMYGNTAGKSAITKIPLTTNQACCNLVINPKKADYRFVYYKILNDYTLIKDLSVGGAQQNLNAGTIKNYEVKVPTLQKQKAIASILSALDDKIENNLQINKTLEEMAMAVYKHWFVDFGPFQEGEFVNSELGEIPKGWEVISTYSLGEFVNGAAFKSKDFIEDKSKGLPVIKIAEIKQGITEQTKYSNRKLDQKYIIENGDILFPWSGNPHTSIGIHFWDKGKSLLNQHIFVIRNKNKKHRFYTFNTLKYLLPKFIRLATHKQTTGLGHITVANLKELSIVFPDDKTIDQYNLEVSPLTEMIYSNQMENINLKNMRDTLLPKLIKGEVRVKDVEKTLSEVL